MSRSKGRSEAERGKVYLVGAGPGSWFGHVAGEGVHRAGGCDRLRSSGKSGDSRLGTRRRGDDLRWKKSGRTLAEPAGNQRAPSRESTRRRTGSPIKGRRSVCFWAWRGRGKGGR